MSDESHYLKRGFFARRFAKAVFGSNRMAMGRVRVERVQPDGSYARGGIESIEYSLPKVKWWNLTGWLWLARRIYAAHQEDQEWLRQSKSE